MRVGIVEKAQCLIIWLLLYVRRSAEQSGCPVYNSSWGTVVVAYMHIYIYILADVNNCIAPKFLSRLPKRLNVFSTTNPNLTYR